jgi:transcriptional regulator with XRE-family HTH domain
MNTGSIVKLLRTADGVSQTALAVELGVARTYLSQIENNKVQPGMTFLRAVSKKFGVPVSLLLIDKDDPDQEIFRELQKLLGAVLSVRMAANKA